MCFCALILGGTAKGKGFACNFSHDLSIFAKMSLSFDA
jgi:hypothetical protein